MQSFTPRTPPMRHTPELKRYGAFMQVHSPVDRALLHSLNGGSRLSAGSFGHVPPAGAHPPHYTPHPLDLQQLTPYQQQYHYPAPKKRHDFYFPFRALMVVMVTGALALSIYAAYRAFTNPSPVNAGLFSGQGR